MKPRLRVTARQKRLGTVDLAFAVERGAATDTWDTKGHLALSRVFARQLVDALRRGAAAVGLELVLDLGPLGAP